MDVKPSCGTCIYLDRCREVTAKKIETEYSCKLWQPAPDAELRGRGDIVRDFGLWALKFEVPHLKNKGAQRPKARRRRKNA